MAATAGFSGTAPGDGSSARPAPGSRRASATVPARSARRTPSPGPDPFPFRMLSFRPSGTAFDADMCAPFLCRILWIPGFSVRLPNGYLDPVTVILFFTCVAPALLMFEADT